jgi:signal transduction histidine kinase
MMNSSTHPSYDQLFYEHEVLWARYEIREHYIRTTIRHIYENIGQVLTHVGMQLRMLGLDKEIEKREAEGFSTLIGQVLKDLRSMRHSFYPETELLGKYGLAEALSSELVLLGMDTTQLKVRGVSHSLEQGREVILFRMLQEILHLIDEQNSTASLEIKLVYTNVSLGFIFNYTGKPVNIKASPVSSVYDSRLSRLSLLQRAELIGGVLMSPLRKASITRMKLIVPFKTFVYEE